MLYLLPGAWSIGFDVTPTDMHSHTHSRMFSACQWRMCVCVCLSSSSIHRTSRRSSCWLRGFFKSSSGLKEDSFVVCGVCYSFGFDWFRLNGITSWTGREMGPSWSRPFSSSFQSTDLWPFGCWPGPSVPLLLYHLHSMLVSQTIKELISKSNNQWKSQPFDFLSEFSKWRRTSVRLCVLDSSFFFYFPQTKQQHKSFAKYTHDGVAMATS